MDLLIDLLKQGGDWLMNFFSVRLGWEKEQVQFLGAILFLAASTVTLYWRLRGRRALSRTEAMQIAKHMAGELKPRDEQISALTAAVLALPAALRASSEAGLPAVPQLQDALCLLKSGDTVKAEAAFTYVLETKSRAGTDALKQAAAAARHLGALASLSDPHKAIAAYMRSVELEPDNPEGWNELGHLYQLVGQPDDARRSYERLLTIAEQRSDTKLEAAAHGNLAIVYMSYGRFNDAEANDDK